MNKVHLIGNLGNEPKIHNTEKHKIAKFPLATTDFGNTQWHNVVCFDKTADIVEKYCSKGKQIAVVGRLEYREHEGKYYTDVVAESIELLGRKDQDTTATVEKGIPTEEAEYLPF